MLNIFDVLLTSRTVWTGIVSIALGVFQIIAEGFYGFDLPFDAPAELLILGGLAAIYSKGGKKDVDNTTKSGD